MRKPGLLCISAVLVVFLIGSVSAQSTEFTYQGSLKDGADPANGSYDLEFALFDASSGGVQLGSTQTRSGVTVTGGIFTVSLDFGAQFPGADRFLEIKVRQAGGGTFTLLTPRQKLNSSPYTIKSLNAENATNATNATIANNALSLGGIAANQYVVTGDPRMSDARNPLPNSANYIQNQNAGPQAASNFNVSGTGTANIFNAATQFNFGGSRVLSAGGTNNLFAGIGAGGANTSGNANAFHGSNAGANNTTGSRNSFFGASSGADNTTGFNNAFFGAVAGGFNTTGAGNSFFGDTAGARNTTGGGNAFFGNAAGFNVETGLSNSFFGSGSGFTVTTGAENTFVGSFAGSVNNTTGNQNTFVGASSGDGNATGSGNTLLGYRANVGANDLLHATAIGSQAFVTSSDTIVLGKVAGTYNGVPRPADTVLVPGAFNVSGTFGANVINATTQFNIGGNRVLSNAGTENLFAGVGSGAVNTGQRNAFFGHQAGSTNSIGNSNAFFGTFAGVANTTGNGNSFFGRNAGSVNVTGSNNTFIGNDANFFFPTPTGLNNTLLGAFTQIGQGVNFSTAIGEGAQVTQSNSLVLGRSDVKVGIGTTAPEVKLHIKGDGEGIRIQGNAVGIANGAYLSFADSAGTSIGYVGDGSSGDNSLYLTSYLADVNLYTPVGATLTASSTGTVLMKGGPAQPSTFAAQVFDNNNGPYKGLLARSVFLDASPGNGFDSFLASPVHVCARIENLGGFGGYVLVRCSAPRPAGEGKTESRPFDGGLNIVRRLNPLSFRWKEGKVYDVGLNANDVALIDPSLVAHNEKGEVEDVQEGALNAVFINAFKEQQQQIESQQQLISAQQRQIDELKKLVCLTNSQAAICSETTATKTVK
jgi:hypothetical protein